MKNTILRKFRSEVLSSYDKSKKMFKYFSKYLTINGKTTKARNNLYEQISFNS